MATRAFEASCNLILQTFPVKAASDVTAGYPVKMDGTDVLNCTAGDAAVGYAMATAAAGELVEIALIGSSGIVKAKVGTGGCTAGAWLKAANDGAINSGTLGGGTTLVNVIGKALQTGSAGDFVGVVPIGFAGVSA